MQFCDDDSARHSCFYFLSVAMKRAQSERERENESNGERNDGIDGHPMEGIF